MKIKLDKPVEFTSSVGNRNMSIGNKDLSDGNQQGKTAYVKVNGSSSKAANVDEIDTTSRVDRVESSAKVQKTNTDYSDMVRQRSEKLNQYRKDLISKTSFESTTKHNSKRDENKKELIAKMSSSNDNIKRVQQEFNDSKEQLTNKIHEQNDSTAQTQSKLRESKRQLLAEIQNANESNEQVKLELQQNQSELVSKTTAQSNLPKTEDTAQNKKSKQVSIEERKVELVKKVMENTNEDATIKQKLNQYKRELATANAKREQLSNQAENNKQDLQKLSSNDNIGNTTELEKIRDIISEQEMAKNFNELMISTLDATDATDSTDNQLEVAEAILKNNKLKASTQATELKKVKVDKPKSTKSDTNSNVVDFSSKVKSPAIKDTYKAPNLTSFDVSLASSVSTISTSSVSTNSARNISDISVEISSNSTNSVSTASTVSTVSTTSTDTSTDITTSTEKQAIKNKINVDTEAKAEIQQKLREYQAEVRKINSEILELTDGDDNKSTSFASYKNATEYDLLENGTSVLFDEECIVDSAIAQMENMFEFEGDLQEAAIMLSAQEEMNSVIKLLATEIKQDELLAKIAEQEQIIARNKILEKRESLIELAKQNNELLRSLNERLAIITKKVSRNVVYAPTIKTQRNRMIA